MPDYIDFLDQLCRAGFEAAIYARGDCYYAACAIAPNVKGSFLAHVLHYGVVPHPEM